MELGPKVASLYQSKSIRSVIGIFGVRIALLCSCVVRVPVRDQPIGGDEIGCVSGFIILPLDGSSLKIMHD